MGEQFFLYFFFWGGGQEQRERVSECRKGQVGAGGEGGIGGGHEIAKWEED